MSLLEWTHLAVFGFAFVGCLFACWRTKHISHPETRYGLYGLFVTSGLWAGTYLVTFLTASATLATAAYLVGLICGIATVGAWLYFCSAYTGQSYHRQSTYRAAAILTFGGISILKLTNPIHGLYFDLELVETPFAHASVSLLGLHWAVTLLAYALSAIGFYMLLQLFSDSHVSTTNLTVLFGVMAVPAGVNALAILGAPGLVAANYEPVGVAIFALGTLYLTEDTFERVRWSGHQQVLDELDDAILLLDNDGYVYEYNAAATRLLPAIEANKPLDSILSEMDRIENDAIVADWHGDADLMTLDQEGTTKYYLSRETELSIGPHSVGRAIVLTDVTRVERQRRELKRHTQQLEGFAAAMAHELRNSLSIIDGNLGLVAESLDKDDIQTTTEILERISHATDRMSDVVNDLVTIAKLSQPVENPQSLEFQSAVREGFVTADSGGIELNVAGEGQIQADRQRFTELICNAVRLAVATDATELQSQLTTEGIVLHMDGELTHESDIGTLLEYGSAVPTADAGMIGPNIKSLAEAHGWEVRAYIPENGGIGLDILNVTMGESTTFDSHLQ